MSDPEKLVIVASALRYIAVRAQSSSALIQPVNRWPSPGQSIDLLNENHSFEQMALA
jgi:hypothetical protein